MLCAWRARHRALLSQRLHLRHALFPLPVQLAPRTCVVTSRGGAMSAVNVLVLTYALHRLLMGRGAWMICCASCYPPKRWMG